MLCLCSVSAPYLLTEHDGKVNIGKRQTWNKKCTTRVTRDSDSTGVVYFQEEVHCYFNNLNQMLVCEDTFFLM